MFKSIIDWNEERNNLVFTRTVEFSMLHEELMEFMSASNEHEEVDALCDLFVIATGAIWKLGYDPDRAMFETIREIKARKQDPIQKAMWAEEGVKGKWQKWKEQPKETLYKANYEKAKI